MPIALNRGYQAQMPSVPTLPIPDPAVREGLAPSLPHFYGLDYFHNRLKALGLSKDNAIDYGLDVDAQGNILQLVRRFDGSFIEFIPQRFRKKVDRILSHRSTYQPHLEMYHRLLAVTRFHPDYLKDHPERSKYGNQYGEKVRALPAPRAINAYNNHTAGGLITFIEGYFKALALDIAGIESVAFTGITVYRIDPALREYLLRRLPDRIFIMYDNDALDVSSTSHPSPGGASIVARGGGQDRRSGRNPSSSLPSSQSLQLSSRRNEDFANSARKFATALFSLFSSVDHTCEIVFVMGKPDATTPIPRGSSTRLPNYKTNPKGIDDLIEAHGSGPITKDLLEFNFTPTFRESRFFAGFTLAKSTCNRKLNRLFLGNNYRHWIERLLTPKGSNILNPGCSSPRSGKRNPGTPQTKQDLQITSAFTYRGATYQPISTGNLYDETITYQLNTDPFAVEVPTDHLVIKQYLTDQRKSLHQLIQLYDRLAIQAPTGSGKTTFLTKLARHQKSRMVIAMPTVNLAEQTARSSQGFLLTGNRDTAKIRAANDKNLIICTYDTLHQVPDLWRRILVIDEAHNLINQYGQVYNGFNPFRAETLRNCVRCFPEAQKTILLSGTMPPLLCHAFNFHLVTFRRLENPTVRVFDIEADGTDNSALSKCLITRLAEAFPSRPRSGPTSLTPGEASRPAASGTRDPQAQQVPTSSRPRSGQTSLTPGEASRPAASGTRDPQAQQVPTSSRPRSGQTSLTPGGASREATSITRGTLHVVFWNNTDQINRLKNTLIELNYLKEHEIAIISRTHYNAGKSPDLDDIIRDQKINPRIKLLLCTCLISEGVNIKNTNVGRIYTVGLRCEDTFRQFIARFRKLKTVNVFSILEAERDLRPEFFQSAKMELLENLERAELQANHLRRRKEAYQSDYDEAEIPFLDQIEGSKEYHYQNQLLNLVYRDGDWHPDPLHVLAAIHGRKLATSNNCYFYTRLRANNFSIFRVKRTPTDELVEETINARHETAKAIRKDFRKKLLENLTSFPDEPINALYLLYQEKDNRHGLNSLRTLVPDLLDDCDGATGAQYLGQHRRHLDDYAKRRILRFAKLHALGVQDKTPFLSLSIADFNHEYQAALFHFEQLVANDPELRKQMLPAHKEEVRIKQKIVACLTPLSSRPRSGPTSLTPDEASREAVSVIRGSTLTGQALLQKLATLLSIPRPRHLPPPSPLRAKRANNSGSPKHQRTNGLKNQFDILGLTPAKAINLVRRIMHTDINGHGRYRTINVGSPFSKASPPTLAIAACNLLKDPVKALKIIDA
ncbi:DEAD/DEAH box helicase [Neolewinella agarilytica]|uniref:DEAD/DEAH box helicase n=1 Tax=Neolewinella agarilytica TaxID=478744 RepID=A0A1H9H7E0_9BACT|nr:DEAD/DEAH box helicase [Neolewinella agarilytica]SEQ58242.1 DEAD/DEAH box helicase [Neolewinella agarilytica]